MNSALGSEQIYYIDERFGTREVPTASAYIMPNGRYIDLRKEGYCHSDLYRELLDLGIDTPDKICFNDQHSYFLYDLGWIAFNLSVRYIELTEHEPTEQQYESIYRLLEYSKPKLMQVTASMYCRYFRNNTPQEIVDSIKNYYKTGILSI